MNRASNLALKSIENELNNLYKIIEAKDEQIKELKAQLNKEKAENILLKNINWR